MSNNHNDPINNITKLCYGIGLCSLLIDTCHIRAFPSYNIITAALAFILNHSSREDPKSRLQFLSCFSILIVLSLVMDVIFCTIWGPEIIEGDSTSAKFSFSFFIINMIIKLPTLFYVMAAQIQASDEYDAVRSLAGDSTTNKHEITTTSSANDKFKFQDTPIGKKAFQSFNNYKTNTRISNSGNKKIAKRKGHNEDSSDDSSTGYLDDYSYEIHSPTSCKKIDTDAPPFTPGVPGLISPYPPKRNHK